MLIWEKHTQEMREKKSILRTPLDQIGNKRRHMLIIRLKVANLYTDSHSMDLAIGNTRGQFGTNHIISRYFYSNYVSSSTLFDYDYFDHYLRLEGALIGFFCLFILSGWFIMLLTVVCFHRKRWLNFWTLCKEFTSQAIPASIARQTCWCFSNIDCVRIIKSVMNFRNIKAFNLLCKVILLST